MNSLISKEEAINALSCINPTEPYIDYDDAVKAINEIPDAFTDNEKYRISYVFQNYYLIGIEEIAEEDEISKSIFQKVGLLDG